MVNVICNKKIEYILLDIFETNYIKADHDAHREDYFKRVEINEFVERERKTEKNPIVISLFKLLKFCVCT